MAYTPRWSSYSVPNVGNIPTFSLGDIGNIKSLNQSWNADSQGPDEQYRDDWGFTNEDNRSLYGNFGLGHSSHENYQILSPDQLSQAGSSFNRNFTPGSWGMMIKTGDKAGTVIPYTQQDQEWVPDLRNAYMREMDTTSGASHRGLLNVALAGIGGGVLGPVAASTAQGVQAANAGYNAYQAAENKDWGAALASGASALAGGAGIAGADELASYANLVNRGAGFYNALESGDPITAAQAGLNTYDAYNKIPSGSMSDMFSGENMSEDYGWPVDDTGEGDWWSDGLNQEEGYDWSSEDPYASDPYANYTPIDDGGYGPGETPGFSTGGGGGYGLSDFFRNPLVSQIGRGLFGGGGNRTAPTGPNRGSGGANRGSPGGGGGGGGGGLGGLLSSWYGSQAQGRYADDLKGIASEMKGNAEPYMQKLLESYTNPQAFMDSPEMQARLGIEANRLTGIDASKGRISNDIGRTKLLQDYGMAGLSDYRRGLTGSLSSIYQPQAISNLYKEASQADRGRYGDYAALLGNGGGISWDEIQDAVDTGGDWWDAISSWWDKL